MPGTKPVAIIVLCCAAFAGSGAMGGIADGVIDPVTSFPISYQDANGLMLRPCLATTGACGAAADIPTTFPNTVFYWIAEARMPTYGGKGGNPDATRPGGQATATLTMTLMGTFPVNVDGDRIPIAGNEVVVQSLQFRLDSLLDQQLYTITTPFGVFDNIPANVDLDGAGLRTRNVDSLKEAFQFPGSPAVPGNFDQSLLPSSPYSTLPWTFNGMDRFLSCSFGVQPTGFLGPVLLILGVPELAECTVTGSPLGPAFDVFRVEGPEVGGGPLLWAELSGTPFATGLDPWIAGTPPVNMIETTRFRITGHVVGTGDADLDGVIDGFDNCPAVANVPQFDQDGDTLGDACDCGPTDATAGAPVETSRVAAAPILLTTSTRYTWTPTAFADRYEILRGDLATPAAPLCITANDFSPFDTEFIETEVPPVGVGWFYLVRGVDTTCGGGAPWGGGVTTLSCP